MCGSKMDLVIFNLYPYSYPHLLNLVKYPRLLNLVKYGHNKNNKVLNINHI